MDGACVVLYFERTTDFELIRQITIHPKLYPHLSDDFSPAPENFQPVQHENFVYLLVHDGHEPLGYFGLHPHTTTLWEVHTVLLPSAWGETAKEAAKGGTQWVWDNLSCIRLITNVPTCNRIALRFAQSSGMEQFGINPDSFVKGNKVYPMVMLGVSRPGIESMRGESCP
jgi:RimJ/RimL family protein N-acetyltransferase